MRGAAGVRPDAKVSLAIAGVIGTSSYQVPLTAILPIPKKRREAQSKSMKTKSQIIQRFQEAVLAREAAGVKARSAEYGSLAYEKAVSESMLNMGIMSALSWVIAEWPKLESGCKTHKEATRG